MQRTGSVSPAAVSSSIAIPSSPSTGAADPAILVIPAQARSGPSSQREKKAQKLANRSLPGSLLETTAAYKLFYHLPRFRRK
jgi:hypothetical protein